MTGWPNLHGWRMSLGMFAATLPLLGSVHADVLSESPGFVVGEAETDQEDAALADPDDLDSLLELAEEDVGQLTRVNVAAPALEMEVSTVSRQVSTVGRSPAAVFVITNEMIRRSGARSIPEVLRMVPGVQVARIDASKWAVSIRGFNGRYANKLLVQIDGRSVYTPLYGGVYWDVQDVVLEDVERIEVIRGPGATVWGANAVNGIINIITKDAGQTQGTYVQGGAGTEERGFTTVRYGGRLGDDAHWRVYGKWFERDRGFALGDDAHDDWRMGRAGFRTDWEPSACDRITLQADLYKGYTGRRNYYPDPAPPFVSIVDDDALVRGGNILGRWTRVLDDDSDWSLQFYYDRTERHFLAAGFGEDRDTIDLDFQHRFPLGWRHAIIWGLAYRNTKDVLRDIPFVMQTRPSRRDADLFSYFVQDEITLRDELLYLTVGSKFEHNDYTGFEFQPSTRLLWTPSPRHSVWAAISRAVRTPTRREDDARLTLSPGPFFPVLYRNRNYESEELLAYEAGIRVQPTDSFSWDLATFFHNYDSLRSWVFDPLLPGVKLQNGGRAQGYGFEFAANYQISPCWKLYGSYNYLTITGEPGSDGDDPRNQIYLQSSWDLAACWELDVTWRYVDALTLVGVPSYNAMDVRLACCPTADLELAVVGRHLLAGTHHEFMPDAGLGTARTEVENEIYGSVTYRY